MRHLEDACFADILRGASREALEHVRVNNRIHDDAMNSFDLLNRASNNALTGDDILVPFFAKCHQDGITVIIEQGGGRGAFDDPILRAYESWYLNSVSESTLEEARVRAFDLIVRQAGFSEHSFSPIERGQVSIVLPFFHVMIQDYTHISMEKRLLDGEKLIFPSALYKAFAWYHFDLMYQFYVDKGIDVAALL